MCTQQTQAAFTAPLSAVTVLLQLLKSHDPASGEHALRVGSTALCLARALELPEMAQQQVYISALLHDVGKLALPCKLLKKPGPLTSSEWRRMHQHPELGQIILSLFPLPLPAIDAALRHHERWDGHGYPGKLDGRDIPLAARIVSVADVWDALRSSRPYKAAWSQERSLAYMGYLAGRQFDPQIVMAFSQMVRGRACS